MPKKGCYSDEHLRNAIRDVQNGTSYREASKKYNIPKSTIEFKIKNPDCKNTFGPSPILSLAEESILVKWIEDTAKAGFPKKANDLKSSVQKFLIDNPRPNPFKSNRPGDGWLKAFLKRHPNISERTSEAVTSASSCVSEKDIRKWFAEIGDYIREKKLEDVMNDPSRIYNGDETGFQICPSTGKVFAAKGTRNVYSIERGSSKENITVMFTFSADGKICCPMIIYPYQRIPEKIANSVNSEWGIGRSDNGWMTSETFYQYIEHVFFPHIVSNNIKLPVVLFVDGHKSHLSYELSILCNKLQIEVIALYPNATRILQPADVSVFRPVKIAWRQGVREWQEENPGEVLNKVSFAPLLEKVISSAIKPEMLINGFRTCGLYPFDPSSIDFSKCIGGLKDKGHNDPVDLPHTSKESVMDYQTFLNIVGKERITKFEGINELIPENIDEDDFLVLFKIWRHFQQEKPALKNVEINKPKINIISNVLIQPQTESVVEDSSTSEIPIILSCGTLNTISCMSQDCNISISQENKPSLQNEIVVVADIHRNNESEDPKKLMSIENYLLEPIVPQRKGKKNSEKFPYAITSKKYQEMIKAKKLLKEEDEARKLERKRKREETKINNQKKIEIQSKKGKRNQDKCFVCKRILKTRQLECDQCHNKFHARCIPKTHQNHIPQEDEDIFLCHSCYKEDSDEENNTENSGSNSDKETDELFELYQQHSKNYQPLLT